MTGRCYADYVEGVLLSQSVLLERLEAMGLEREDRRVLTTKRLGVPMTTMLLVCRDAVKAIEQEQAALSAAHVARETVETPGLLAQYGLEYQPGATEFSPSGWQRSTPWVRGDLAVSGCSVYQQTNVFTPSEAPPSPLTSIFRSRSPELTVYSSIIRVDAAQPEARPMITLFRPLFIALEAFYGIEQRLRYEAGRFVSVTATTFEARTPPDALHRWCNRRGPFLHEGNLSLELAPETSELFIGEEQLVAALCDCMSVTETWLENNYAGMLANL